MSKNSDLTRIKRPVLLPLAVTFIILTSAFLASILWIEQEHAREKFLSLKSSIEASFLRKLDDEAALLSSHLFFISNSSCFQNAWRSQDRQALLACSRPVFQQMQAFFQVSELNYITDDFNYFLRVNEPSRYGDSERGRVVHRAANTGELSYGLELSQRGQLLLVIAKPWHIENSTPGFIEMEIDISDVVYEVATVPNVDLFAFIEKKKINRALWTQEASLSGSDYGWEFLENHIVTIGDPLSFPYKQKHFFDGHIIEDEEPAISYRDKERSYSLGKFPLLDEAGRYIGHIGIILDNTEGQIAIWGLLGRFLILFLVAGGILFLLFVRYLGRIDLRLATVYHDLNQEITERKRMEISLRKLSSAVEQGASAVVITTDQGEIEYVNPRFSEVTGYSLDEIRGKTPRILRSGETQADRYKDLWNTILAGRHWVGDLHNRKKSGELYWSHLSISPITTDSGKITNYVAVSEDVTELKSAHEQMERMAFYDTLTELPNRRLFKDRLEWAIKDASRKGSSVALLFLDLDHFKHVNDTLGHEAGDLLLKSVARTLTKSVRGNDTVARLGGDEFTILLTDIQNPSAARKVAEKILQSLRSPVYLEGKEVTITTSIGITLGPEDGIHASTLMKYADLAMYKAKEKGRKNYQFYTSAMNDEVQQRVRIERELTSALENSEFRLFYQPLIRIHDRKMVGMEALIRWQHPKRGLLSPYEFLTVAEETGLINSIGDWVLRQACQDTTDLHRDGYGDIVVSVNLAASQFRDVHLPKTISGILTEKSVESRWLDLEITESILMENTDQVVKTLQHLKALGVTLSVDDFGTGYSSLSYLKRFPVDRLKVDRSFVQDIPGDRNDVEITAAIIAMSHKLNLQVVAEGVETAEQFEFLQQNACDICQGYMFSEPVPINKLRQYLEEQKK